MFFPALEFVQFFFVFLLQREVKLCSEFHGPALSAVLPCDQSPEEYYEQPDKSTATGEPSEDVEMKGTVPSFGVAMSHLYIQFRKNLGNNRNWLNLKFLETIMWKGKLAYERHLNFKCTLNLGYLSIGTGMVQKQSVGSGFQVALFQICKRYV